MPTYVWPEFMSLFKSQCYKLLSLESVPHSLYVTHSSRSKHGESEWLLLILDSAGHFWSDLKSEAFLLSTLDSNVNFPLPDYLKLEYGRRDKNEGGQQPKEDS